MRDTVLYSLLLFSRSLPREPHTPANVISPKRIISSFFGITNPQSTTMRQHLPILLLALTVLTACSPIAGPEPAPSVEMTDQAIIAAVQATGEATVQTHVSPDGQWRVALAQTGCVPTAAETEHTYETVHLLSGDGTDTTLVESQLINCGGLGAYGFEAFFWSPNSRYFYYTTARTGVPDGCGPWVRPVRRLDTADATTVNLGSGWPSPDGAYLATWLKQELVLWDLDGEELGRLPAAADQTALAALSWSPDSRALVYLQAPSPCVPQTPATSSVVQVTAPDAHQTLLLETQTPLFSDLAWTSPATVQLIDTDGGHWLLDVTTRMLTIATPTP